MSTKQGWIRRFVRDTKGVSVVEFALAAPMLVLAAVGLGDFGLAVNEKMRLVSAARAGAQAGFSSAGNVAGMQAAVLAATGLPANATTVSASTFCGCANGGTVSCGSTCQDGSVLRTYVTVTVSEVYSMLLGYPGFARQQTLTGSSTLRIS